MIGIVTDYDAHTGYGWVETDGKSLLFLPGTYLAGDGPAQPRIDIDGSVIAIATMTTGSKGFDGGED